MGDNPASALIDPQLLERLVRERVDAILDERLEAKLEALRASRTMKMHRACAFSSGDTAGEAFAHTPTPY